VECTGLTREQEKKQNLTPLASPKEEKLPKTPQTPATPRTDGRYSPTTISEVEVEKSEDTRDLARAFIRDSTPDSTSDLNNSHDTSHETHGFRGTSPRDFADLHDAAVRRSARDSLRILAREIQLRAEMNKSNSEMCLTPKKRKKLFPSHSENAIPSSPSKLEKSDSKVEKVIVKKKRRKKK